MKNYFGKFLMQKRFAKKKKKKKKKKKTTL